MGNLVSGPHRRGLPATRRALVPGAPLSDVRDGDVVVLSLDGTHLKLDVVVDGTGGRGGASSSGQGERGDAHDSDNIQPAYALVPEPVPGDGLANAGNHVVVDVRGRHIAFRSVAAGNLFLCVGDEEEHVSSTGARSHKSQKQEWTSSKLRFRGRSHVRKHGLFTWRFDESFGCVRFAPRKFGDAFNKSLSDDANLNSTRLIAHTFRLTAVGPRHCTRVAAAQVWVAFLRTELGSRKALASETNQIHEDADAARSKTLQILNDALRRTETRNAEAADRTRRRVRRDELRFLDGLTGVVDALRDQVKGAATEPVGLSEGNDGDGNDTDSNKLSRSHWAVDASHLATVSRVWDLSVTEFRAGLKSHSVDDTPVAALQAAIQKSAYEHFVVTGMRRYLLNRDDGEEDELDGDGDILAENNTTALIAGSLLPPSNMSSLQSTPQRGFTSPTRQRALGSSPSSLQKKSEWERAVAGESERRKDARLRRAERRARLKARARAGEAAVDFRKWKVGSLRAQLERSGVDAGPLAALVHCLAHASREQRSDLYAAGADFRVSRASGVKGSGNVDSDDKSPNPNESRSPNPDQSDSRFKTFLVREKLNEDLQYLRDENIDPEEGNDDESNNEGSSVHSRVLDAMTEKGRGGKGGSHETAGDSEHQKRHNTVRAAANAAATAARIASKRDRHGKQAPNAAALAVVTFVGGLTLADLRVELHGNSLLAGGLDECVDALVEMEWEGGNDGFIGKTGERASGIITSLTVNAFRKRLKQHGLEGSLLELNLLTDALVTTLASDG